MTWRMIGVFGGMVAAAFLCGYALFLLTADLSWGVWGGIVAGAILLTGSAIFGPRYRRWLTGASLEEVLIFPHLLRRARIIETGWRVAAPLLGISLVIGLFPSTGFLSPEVKFAVSLALLGLAALVMIGVTIAAYGFVRDATH
jgi:hypothetical protein